MDEIKLKPCPFCGGKGVEILEDEKPNYCPNCGAKMDLEEENNDN